MLLIKRPSFFHPNKSKSLIIISIAYCMVSLFKCVIARASVIAGLAGSTLLISCSGEKLEKGEVSQIAGVPKQSSHTILTVVPRSIVLFDDFPATLEGQQNVEIRPMIDGYLEKSFVDEGATVIKGQKLFQIRAPQYEQEVRTAKANIEIARANLNAAQMQVNKVRPLVEKMIISQYELQTAEYNLQSKRAALAQAKATLANAQANLDYTIVTSPANGVIGTIPYKVGSLVTRNIQQPLTMLSDIENVYAYFSINEKQAADFFNDYKGATMQQLDSLPAVNLLLANGNEYPYKGRIEAVSGLINSATRAITLRATFPNPNLLLRSGGTGQVRIPATLDNALLIPQKSTYEIQGKTFAYLVDKAGNVSSTAIKVKTTNNGEVFVVEDGLKAGDKIVIDGVASLREGTIIKPIAFNADSLFSKSL